MNYQTKAETAYSAVFQHFNVSNTNLFREHSPSQLGDQKYSYLWPYIGMLSATNAMVGLPDPQDEYLSRLRQLLAGLELYWQAPGYASYVVADGSGQRFYDDNAWVAMELLAAYNILKDRALLDRAQVVFDFVISGWSSDLGGGLFWREGDRSTKNTCSNGPAAVLALQLYQATGDGRYLAWAKRLYEWTMQHLRAPNGLYWDNIDGSGRINRATYTYNTGIMIQAQVLLYQAQGDKAYYDGAVELAGQSLDGFAPVTTAQRFFPATPWFNAVLFRGYLALRAMTGDASFAGALLASLEHGWDHARDALGLVWPDWSGRAGSKPFARLLDQAPVAEIYALAAGFAEMTVAGGAAADRQTAPDGNAVPVAADAATSQTVLSPMGTNGYSRLAAGQGTYVSARYGIYTLDGAAYDYYERLGGPAGTLGYAMDKPTPAAVSPAGTRGMLLRLEGSRPYLPQVTARLKLRGCGATLYWTERYGPHATHLNTGACYESFGGSGGILGYPMSDRLPASRSPHGTTGYFQRFEGGSIYESQPYGAHSVTGAISTCYEKHGGTGSGLGFPTTDVSGDTRPGAPAGAIRQRFESGWITLRPGADAQIVYD
jgi:hypothetical protein